MMIQGSWKSWTHSTVCRHFNRLCVLTRQLRWFEPLPSIWADLCHFQAPPPIWECLYKCLGKEELQCLVSVKNFLKDWVVYFLSLKESPLGASLILRSFSQRVKWITLKEIATQQAPSHFPLLSSFFNTVTWLVLNSQKFVSLLFLSAGMKYMCCHVWPST